MSYEPPPSAPDPAGQSPQYGPPADPYGPPSDPFNAPPPTAVWNPTPGGGDPYTPPGGYGPPSGGVYGPPPGDPYGPSGGGYGPPSGDPYAPPGGVYGPPSGDPYGPSAPVSGYPPAPAPGYGPPAPVSGYPPPGYGPPQQGVPGYGPPPMSPVLPAKKSKTLMIVLIAVSVILVLCCGGAFAAVLAFEDEEDPVAAGRPDISTSQPTTGSTGRDLAPPDQAKNDPETENMKVGDTLVLTSTDGDELRVTVRKVTSRTKGCREYSTEPDNGTYVVVEVTAEVVKGTASINPLYLNFVDAAGVEENSIGGIFSGCGEPLRSGVNLPAGTKREGTIVFDVKAAKGKIVYSELGGGVRGSWTVG